MKKKINKKIPKYKFGAAEVSGAVSTAASGIAGAAGISLDSAVGGALKGLGAGLSSIPTPYTQIAGAALSTVGSFWGEAGSVNQQTGEINKGSGLSRLFGRSQASLRRESNRIKNSIVDRELTTTLNYQYYNDPNNSANMNVFAAAEGGVIPGHSEVMLDSREFIISPDRGSGKRLGYAKGTDTIHAVVPNYTGVLSEDVKDEDGISFAEKGDKIDKMLPDEHPLKKILNLKLLNRQEVVKIKKIDRKHGAPAYEKGGVTPYDYNKNLEEFEYWDKEKNEYKQEYLDWVNKLTEQDVKDIESKKYGDMSTYFGKNSGKKLDVATAQKLMTDKKYGDWHKIGKSFVDSKLQTNTKEPDYLDYKPSSNVVFNTVEAPFIRTRVAANRNVGLGTIYNGTKSPQLKPLTNSQINASSEYYRQSSKPKNSNDISALDYLNLMGPLANTFSSKPEKVDVYASRTEFGPTYYNERPAVEQFNKNRAITNYNASKVNSNTGANMAFALQSQMNTDTAIGNILAQKENVQNQRAFSNTDIYNDWSNRYANARHVAAVEQAQNDAASRNIRRKGVGDLFTNVGKIVRDRRLSKRDAGLYEAMLPYLEYGMTADQLKKLTELYS